MQITNANTKIRAISSASISGARKSAAVSSSSSKLETSKVAPTELEEKAKKVSPPELEEKAKKVSPLLALEGWGLAAYDSSSDEEEEEGAKKKGAAAAKPSAAAKKQQPKSKVKVRATSKEKYPLSRPAAPASKEEDPQADSAGFMPGNPAGFGDLPSSFDPFADATRADDAAAATSRDVVHLRVQQRNGRKTLTTVQGLSADYNYAKILRDLKRELCCSGIVVVDEDLGKVIQLQGDHRKSVGTFLVKAGMATKNNVKIHGA